MAEFVMKDIVEKRGASDRFLIDSAATSAEEQGNPMHYGTRKKLTEKRIPFNNRYARKILKSDYGKYDYIICMDRNNIRDLNAFFGGDRDGKISLLLTDRSVADPWYTGDFDKTYDDILHGCTALADRLL